MPWFPAGGGACGYGDLDIFRYGRYTAGLSAALFGRGGACGGCYELRCVNHIRWCLRGSPTVVVTATDFCPANMGAADEAGGWCNFPREHLELSEAAFLRVAKAKADIVPVQFRRYLACLILICSLFHSSLSKVHIFTVKYPEEPRIEIVLAILLNRRKQTNFERSLNGSLLIGLSRQIMKLQLG